MSFSAAKKHELTLDAPDVTVQRTSPCATPCATPKGYRAIALDITPTTWQADLSKCNVCEERFTWLNHRHKCRSCMEAVCNSCSKDRKVLRARTAPKRVCDTCIKNCWTPRDSAAAPRKPMAADVAATKPAGKDGRRVSLTVSASDANACPIDATATAPLSPGTPATAGFFGPGCVTPSATTAALAPPVQGAANKNTTTATGNVDTRPPSSSSCRRHRRQVSVAMPPVSLLTSPAASASSMMMPPPPTPAAAAAAAADGEKKVEETDDMPPSAAGTPSSLFAPPPPSFFGGRRVGGGNRGSRRESSGGRLESGVWGDGLALGGGGDVDKAVAELQQLQEEVVAELQKLDEEIEEAGGEGQQAEAAVSAPAAAPAALPEGPAGAAPSAAAAPAATVNAGAEEPAGAAPAAVKADADSFIAAEQEEEEEEEGDYGEGGPMMVKIPEWSGVVFSGVAIGTGIATAVLLRSAFSLVRFN